MSCYEEGGGGSSVIDVVSCQCPIGCNLDFCFPSCSLKKVHTELLSVFLFLVDAGCIFSVTCGGLNFFLPNTYQGKPMLEKEIVSIFCYSLSFDT